MSNGVKQDKLHCVHCGEDVRMVGPETWHTESTMIRCEDRTSKAEVNWAEFSEMGRN